MAKYVLFIFLYFLLGSKSIGQTNLQTFINTYNTSNLTDAKRYLQAFPGFQMLASLKNDSLIGNIKEGKIIAYIKLNKTNIEFSFTDETLYKSLYQQAEKYFKYTSEHRRGTRGNGTSWHTTSFSNYEGAKIGSLEAFLVVVSSTASKKIIRYELLLFTYNED